MKLWEKLNGKKTTISALLMVIGKILSLLGYGEWADVIKEAGDIILDAGAVGAVVGLTHKAVK